MKTYFGYVRVSTTEQGKGASPAEQKRAISEYASRNNLTVIKWFEENTSAAKLGRKQFNLMLGELEAGRAAGVIIHKIDRSARNLKDWVQLNELFDHGVEVRFAHEGLDLNSRSGRLTGDILAVIASDFIRNNRQEVLKGFYGRLNQGLYPLKAPLGYLDRGKGKPKEVDPRNGPLVRQMFELYGTGRYSLWTLRAEMKRRGLRNTVGKPLSVNATSRLLHNPFYIGIIRIERRNETFQGVHKPLIRKRLFDHVQTILSGRTPTRVKQHDFTYRRMIKCIGCGRSLYGELQKGHVYYRCHTRECRGTSIAEIEIECGVSALLGFIAFSEEEMRDFRDVGDEEKAKDAGLEEQRLANVKRSLALCEDRLTRLTDALIDQSIDKEAFDARKATLLGERRELLDALEHPEERLRSDELFEKLELGNTAQMQLKSLVPAERREVVELTISNLVAEGKELGIALQFPFDVIAAARFPESCALAGGTFRTGSKGCRIGKPKDVPASKPWSHRKLKRLYLTLKRQIKEEVEAERVKLTAWPHAAGYSPYDQQPRWGEAAPARRSYPRPVPAQRH